MNDKPVYIYSWEEYRKRLHGNPFDWLKNTAANLLEYAQDSIMDLQLIDATHIEAQQVEKALLYIVSEVDAAAYQRGIERAREAVENAGWSAALVAIDALTEARAETEEGG